MTHTTTPDTELQVRLAELCLHSGPRAGFDALQDALYDAYRSGQLITRAEADARVAAEREACAVVADEIGCGLSDNEYEDEAQGAFDVAAAIRARGVKP